MTPLPSEAVRLWPPIPRSTLTALRPSSTLLEAVPLPKALLEAVPMPFPLLFPLKAM